MTDRPRRPGAFPLDPPPRPPAEPPRRAPRAIAAEGLSAVEPAGIDIFDAADAVDADPPPPPPARRRSRVGAVAAGAFAILFSLAIGLWTDRLIRDLFARADWLGWLAFGVAVVGFVALAVFVAREVLAVSRLRAAERIHARAEKAIAANDAAGARAVVAELTAIAATLPDTAAGRATLAALKDEIIDGPDLIRLAEAELLIPLDVRARALTLDAAKRVSVVTAVSPRALVDLAYVLFESARLVRRIAELYGARPGFFGSLRLARRVLAHLAVTGAIAAGDEFVHQIVGQGLAARLSAKLGEGLVNGMMTARIGLAAMETVRPLPFAPERRPRLADFLSALASFTKRQSTGAKN